MEAKGELICFMDGHVILKHDYFQDTFPLFWDEDIYVIFAPEVYHAELLYEYPAHTQLNWEKSATIWEPKSDKPYPVLSACQACTMVRREIMDLFFPQDELDNIPYSMDEPYTPMLAWMFGKKVLMNVNTYFAHRPWAYTPKGNWDYESWRPVGAYAIGGQPAFEKSYNYWHSDKKLIMPEKHRQFILKNVKVKFEDLPEYFTNLGIEIDL